MAWPLEDPRAGCTQPLQPQCPHRPLGVSAPHTHAGFTQRPDGFRAAVLAACACTRPRTHPRGTGKPRYSHVVESAGWDMGDLQPHRSADASQRERSQTRKATSIRRRKPAN